MKRVFALASVCMILLCTFAVPVSATEEDYGVIEVLDFCMPNDGVTARVYSGTMPASFTLDTARSIRYIDIVFAVPDGETPTTVSASIAKTGSVFADLTIINIRDNIWRAYGTCDIFTQGFFIAVGSGISWVEFMSVRVSYSALTGTDETGTCVISALGYSATINYIPTDLINYRSFVGDSDYENNDLMLLIQCPNWRKYDYLDIYFSLDIASLNTVSVTLGDTYIPFSSSITDSGTGVINHYDVVLRLDIREVDRTTNEELVIVVRGNVVSGGSNFVSMDGIRGFYLSASLDSDAPWYRKLLAVLNSGNANTRNIWSRLGDILEALQGNTQPAEDFNADVYEQVIDLDEGKAELDKLEKPDLNTDLGELDVSPGEYGFLVVSEVVRGAISSEYMGFGIFCCLCLGIISYLLYGRR